MNDRVLITGGQGFVGRYLAARWLGGDPRTRVLCVGRSRRMDRTFTHRVTWGGRTVPAPVPAFLQKYVNSSRYRYASIDLLEIPPLAGLIRQFRPSVIVHLACALRDEPLSSLTRLNIEATASLIEAVEKAGITAPRLIIGSSGGVYGRPGDGDLPLREERTGIPTDLYSASKLASEHVAQILCTRHAFPALRARIFNVVGPGQDERHFCGWLASQAAAIIAAAREPAITVGNLETSRDFIDVRDVADALIRLSARGRPGLAYNVGSGVETPMREVFRETLRLSGLEGHVEIRKAPDRPIDIARHYASTALLESLEFRRNHSLAESLDDLLDYYRVDVRTAASAIADGQPSEK